ncbi:cobyric acid synthase CobQ [Methanobrevibacter wolinii]|uniref:cobyric acid synthase CobQ n=1 Tax=Methanobrevibacter wolinii TaxID=190977 RepID=UPI0005B2AACA|nr:cobyric acid synthase CobQ [Methanobrevibacter wolinii]
MTKALMIQGTSSNAGKSLFVTALCRIYMKRGYKVAPFKSQNMSLNSYTTSENGEIGIAQYIQALAAKKEATVDMNPILLKPKGDFKSQVIIHGKAVGDMDFYYYQHKYHDTAVKAIHESYDKLAAENDILFIEGAGSPSEINMRKEDIANMEVAHMADANVILVADIDRGGVFAAIAGTFVLLDDRDLARMKAVIINKFSGNIDILKPGIDKIEKIINVPILGVVPYDKTLKIPEEDSQSLREHNFVESEKDINIAVIKLPKIANFTDIDPFEVEPDVGLKMIELTDSPTLLDDVDAIIIPGTRSSTGDAKELMDSGFASKIIELSDKIPVIGICGGYQILGNEITDEHMKESNLKNVKCLGLLNIKTEFTHTIKAACQTKAIIPDNDYLCGLAKVLFKDLENTEITGYEQHEGTTKLINPSIDTTFPLFIVKEGVGNDYDSPFDGATGQGLCFGTYMHGIFHNYSVRKNFLNYLRKKKGIKLDDGSKDPYEDSIDNAIEQLAKLIEDNVDMDYIDKLIFGED